MPRERFLVYDAKTGLNKESKVSVLQFRVLQIWLAALTAVIVYLVAS